MPPKLVIISHTILYNIEGQYSSVVTPPSQRLQGYLADDGSVLTEFRKPKGADLAAKLKAKAPADLGMITNYNYITSNIANVM